MGENPTNNIGAERTAGSRWQFELRGVFWLIALVAVACGVHVGARRLWGNERWKIVLTAAVLFCPLISALAAWTYPGLGVTRGAKVVAYVCLGTVVAVWIYAGCTGYLFEAVLVMFVVVAVFWCPQGLIVYSAVAYLGDHDQQEQASDA